MTTRRAGLAAAVAVAALAVGFGGDADRDGILDGALTPQQAAERPEDDQLIVSIGDSVASGEGNPDVRGRFGRPPRWLLERCHRSLLSGHAQAALAIERDDPEHEVAFVPLGCSGGTVPVGLLGTYRGQRPQVDEVNELAEQREIDALLVSVGANDSLFAPLVSRCLAVRDCEERPFQGKASLRAAVDAAIADLPRRYALLDAALSDEIDRDRVLLVEYFDPTRDAKGNFCTLRIGPTVVDEDEAEWMHEEVLRPLNAAVRAGADAHGWRLVDGVDEAFAPHGICTRPQRDVWVRTFEESIFRQDLSHKGTLHPNARGHRATARVIHPVLAEVVGVEPTEPGEHIGEDDESDVLDDGDLALVVVLAGVAVVAVLALLVWRRRR